MGIRPLLDTDFVKNVRTLAESAAKSYQERVKIGLQFIRNHGLSFVVEAGKLKGHAN